MPPRNAPKRPDKVPVPTGGSGAPAPAQRVRDAVDSAAAKADWITAADAAALELARKLAGDIDRLGPEDAAQLAAVARIFLAVLDKLGLTVAGRRTDPTAIVQEEDPLAALRLRAEARLTDTPPRDTATIRAIKGR